MKTIYRHTFLALACAMIAAGCSDDKTYEPGPADAPDCMGVYFADDNDHDFIFVPGEANSIEVKMHRVNTGTDADVPLICKSTKEGVVFPQSVHFDAGCADAVASIDCSGLPVKETARISVTVPDEYIQLYSEQLFCYETSALVSQWVPANDDGNPVTIYFTEEDYNYNNSAKTIDSAAFQPIECSMEVLPGAGRIRVHDFLNSGTDMTFALTPSPYSDFDGAYRVSPTNNWISMVDVYDSDAYGDEWYNCWFLTIDSEEEEDGWDYPTLTLTTLDGASCDLDYPSFYWYSNSYAFEYSYALLRSGNMKYNSISMGFSGTPSDNVTLPSYFYIFFRWTGESGL